LGLDEGCFLVLAVGRLAREKNYPMLLRLARRSGESLRARFVIVGPGELECDLKREGERLKVSDAVRFVGLRLDVARLLRSADAFCMTSSIEGFPNALVEAMVAGLPIVSTRFPGAEEIIEHGSSGLLVPLDDDAAAHAALESLVRDPVRASALGQRAREEALRRFSIATMVGATRRFYEELLGGRRRT
jgi:glycosyltransferase involved in cell wall biosynthesis